MYSDVLENDMCAYESVYLSVCPSVSLRDDVKDCVDPSSLFVNNCRLSLC